MTVNMFYANDDEDTRCVQACYQMTVARTVGAALTMGQAETQTGYESGMLTWQFQMLLSLADVHGLYVVDHEFFDVHEFIDDPVGSLRKQIDDEDALSYQLENTDLSAEVRRAKACVDHDRISFVNGVPGWTDLVQARQYGAALICLLNGAALYDRPGYRPHSVVVHDVDADRETILLDDPGPPPFPELNCERERFTRAWQNPTPTVANYIAASRRPLGILSDTI